ncbi:MAG: hypothetical protein RL386_2142 [Bacteroidota bacterium]
MALRTKLYLDGVCVKRFLPPSPAEYSFETDVFFKLKFGTLHHIIFGWRLCKKSFAAYGGRIFF